MREVMMRQLDALRHEPTEKRVRATLGGRTAVDSRRALLVWEPRRIIPTYAVPAEDVSADLQPAEPARGSDAPLLHPGIAFAVHTTPGQAYDVQVGAETRKQAAFRPVDPDLGGHLLLDFDAFDWREEDEPVFGHPRDPYHRVDTRPSSRHVRVERDGVLLAESDRPTLLFETNLPTRFYLPRAALRAETLPNDRVTFCPYKGRAGYLSFPVGESLAWCYENPLPDVAAIAGLVSFFDEVVDVTVDGVLRERPTMLTSKTMVEEFGVA